MNIPFKLKALLLMMPVLVIVSVLYTYDAIRAETEIIRSEMLKRAETITTLATKNGELPILSGNPELLKTTASFLRFKTDVSAVTFYDSRMSLLVHDGQPLARPIPVLSPRVAITMAEEADAFVYYAPVFTVRSQEDIDIFGAADSVSKVKENIGWVRLGFSKSALRESERRIVARGVVLALVSTAGSSLLVYLLASMATRPLRRIVKVARAISLGDLSQDIAGEQRDEIGALADAFSTMKHTIELVLRETDTLILAVQAGKLDIRSNAGAFEGGWRKLVEGVNNLTDAFAKNNEELQLAKETAESASRAKSEFLSSMSHELRTPLNAILGYAQILKRQDNFTESQRQQLEIMRTSGDHLLTLINDILDVGKIEARKMELVEVPFHLPTLLLQVFNIARIKAEEKDLRFHYQGGEALPDYVCGDERKLRQILLNLLSNAVRYTRRGSVTLKVGYGQGGRGWLRCEVRDTGIGIAASELETIFEPFTQLAADRQVQEGTGLGLTITKRLTALMGGQLGLDSSVGRGSVFWLELPLPVVADVGIAAANSERAVIGYPGDRKRVLVVDDNITNASLLVSLLEPLGFEVATAQNGREGVLRAVAQRSDLVLLDLVMPEMDGLQAAKELRQRPELPGVKIIGASATVTDNRHKEAFAAVCDDFVVKPIAIDLLLDKIGEQLGIVWETAPAVPPQKRDVPREQDEALVAPPPEELRELYELALMGNVGKIEEWAFNLEQGGDSYRAFARELGDLAGRFKMKAILALVKQHLEASAPTGEDS